MRREEFCQHRHFGASDYSLDRCIESVTPVTLPTMSVDTALHSFSWPELNLLMTLQPKDSATVTIIKEALDPNPRFFVMKET